MKKIIFASALSLLMMGTNANANVIDSISTSASGTFFGDSYGYTFTIEQHDIDTFHATLTNVSPASTSGAKIDTMAFNMNAILGTDFTIDAIVPNWTFAAGSGGVQFDYVGDADSPFDKLANGETLSFNFEFTNLALADFTSWTDTGKSLGTGIGGGDDLGQVAVSFQTLGTSGNDSDLLASNWEGGTTTVPEPASIMLMGLGLLGMGATARRRKKS